MLAPAANALVRFLLEPPCAACLAPLEQPLRGAVCPHCWASVPHLTPPLCPVCGDPQASATDLVCWRCLSDPPPYDTARSAGLHHGSLRAIIHAFKYQGRRTLAAPLGALLRDAGADLLATADFVIPVPLHPLRAMSRGFNQADDLARQLGLPVCRPLRRFRYGPPQAMLDGRARRENVRRVFSAQRLVIPTFDGSGGRLKGRRVVLVDDVMTTGATIDACARALLEGGVAGVSVLTVARVPAPPPVPRLHEPRPSTVPHR